MKKYQVFCSIGLSDVGIYLRDAPSSNDIGIVNLHSSKGTHWAVYSNEIYSDSYGCVPPRKLSKLIIKRNVHCLYSECKLQGLTYKKDSYCAN